ncbi:MAG: spermidine synthase [Candidatus Limnocylindria bacterium]
MAGAPIRLFLTSATLLFVELLLIRWIPANVTYVGFFSNFLLMASFLGIGLGILRGRRITRLVISPFPILLLGTVVLVYAAQLNVQLKSGDEIFFGLSESGAANVNFAVLPLMVVLVVAIMGALALPLGPLLRAMPPLKAYAVDIAGSMFGIAAFTALSAAGTNPFVWFCAVAVLTLVLAMSTGITRSSAIGGAAMLLVLVISASVSQDDIWSPYYRVTAYSDLGRTSINVNGIPHQTLWAVDDERKEPFYEQAYRWFPERRFDRVLIVGAGSGSDTAVALSHGARHVDAVEIDPAIQRIGVDRHPDHPYADPRVKPINNDGRAFLRNSNDRYDLIVFALPDSLTLVSTTANLRLESFLFTDDAFASVRDHLANDGVFVLYNYYREPWLVAKLASMLEEQFGHRPLIRMYGNGVSAALAAGPAVGALDGGDPPGDTADTIPDIGRQPLAATDDWPFLYLRQPFIATYYLAALSFVVVGALLAVVGAARVTATPLRRFSPHFFVLGTAFLLLETRSLVSFSLLFGTTWIVNALAFFAILASVLLAIFVNARFRLARPRLFYAGLFASLLLSFLLPPESLLIDPPWLRYVVAAGLAFAPVFFANLVFSYSFRDTRTADMAFASNLLGAMVGGALEYLALVTGYRALLILVAVLYVLAYVFARHWRWLADVNLAREHPVGGSRAVAEAATS